MSDGKFIISIVIAVLALAVAVYVFLVPSQAPEAVDHSLHKKLAGELTDNNLYQAAVDEYKRILSDDNIDNETRANVNYLMGKIYFENLRNYENAAAHYIKARSLNPDGSFYDEAGKNLIACLEKMGRMIDAKRELDKTVNIDSVYAEHEGETVVAKIGDMPVFLSDIEDDIQKLPAELQKDFMSKEQKLEALNAHIGVELVYRAAVREGLDQDPEIQEMTEQLVKQAIVDKYVSDKVLADVKIDESDVRNYYEANKDKKYDGQAYDEVKSKVLQDYQQEKARQAFQQYVNKLAAVEKVQIFEEKIK
jgi:tetratricopeptide (TPR) repeat protein